MSIRSVHDMGKLKEYKYFKIKYYHKYEYSRVEKPSEYGYFKTKKLHKYKNLIINKFYKDIKNKYGFQILVFVDKRL